MSNIKEVGYEARLHDSVNILAGVWPQSRTISENLRNPAQYGKIWLKI